MFNQGHNKISLIIVYDNKTEEYATFLQQLISQNDDSGEAVVGVKDGTVDATIWSTKEYEHNLPKLTSNTHVIFLGSSKVSKNHGRNVNFIFNKYGMNYGWLGKRAVLYVDSQKLMNKKQYEEFLDFCKDSYKKFERINMVGALPYATALFGAAFLPLSLPIFGFIAGGVFSVAAAKNQRKINDQQFRCLTMVFYMDGLQKFLEG